MKKNNREYRNMTVLEVKEAENNEMVVEGDVVLFENDLPDNYS